MAIDSLRANKVRSLLTMLGIIIGTGTLVAVLSLGNALQSNVLDQFIDLGMRSMVVSPGDPNAQGARNVPGYGLLSLRDYRALETMARQRSDLFRATAPQAVVSLNVRAGTKAITAPVVGTIEQFGAIRNAQVDYGRFLTEADDRQRAPIAILGGVVARNLFGSDPAALEAAIGRIVEVNGRSLEIVGITPTSGTIFRLEEQVFVPLQTLRLRVVNDLDLPGRGARLESILIGLQNEQNVLEAEQVVRTTLRAERGVPARAIDDFDLATPAQTLSAQASINSAVTGFIALVAGISLLVGGIGIMNIMLVSVTERTREIGVRKALGASNGDILGQFIIEATALSLTGGIIGVSGAIGCVLLVSSLTGIATPISWSAVIIALLFAAVVGISFGSYPAQRAARLLPMEALRYE